MLEVDWAEAAVKDLDKLDKPIAQRILTKISWFSNNLEGVVPEPLGSKFKGTFKLRIGDWRVIYTLENEVMVIQLIGHRKEIYNIK